MQDKYSKKKKKNENTEYKFLFYLVIGFQTHFKISTDITLLHSPEIPKMFSSGLKILSPHFAFLG